MLKKYLANSAILRKFLLGYWASLIGIVSLYLYSLVLVTGQSFQTLLSTKPSMAVALFITLMTGMNLLLFYKIEDARLNSSSKQLVLYFLLLQQLCTQNLLGAGLLFAYIRVEKLAPIQLRKVSPSVWPALAFLLFSSLFSLFLLWRLSGLLG